jgi:hypothetical protein
MDVRTARSGKSGFTAHVLSMLDSLGRGAHSRPRTAAARRDAQLLNASSNLNGGLTGQGSETASQEHRVRSEARIATTRADRYAKQLCSHAARMTSRAAWIPPEGVIEFPGDRGTCRMTAEPAALVLEITAADSANLARLQQIISRNIERFANRDGLTVEWTQP